MRTFFLAAALLAAAGAPAVAQTSLDQKAPGIARGIGAQNSSGQNGEFAIYRGSNTVVVTMQGTGSRPESVTIERGFACRATAGAAVASLGSLRNGRLQAAAPMALGHLLSGNYNVVVHNNTPGSRSVACGHIYLPG